MSALSASIKRVEEIMAESTARQAAARRALDAVRDDLDRAIMVLLDDFPGYWTPSQVRRNGCFSPPTPFHDLHDRYQTGRIRSALERLRRAGRAVRVEGIGDTRRGAVQYRSMKWERARHS